MTVPRHETGHETGEDAPRSHSEHWQREQWRQAGDEPFWPDAAGDHYLATLQTIVGKIPQPQLGRIMQQIAEEAAGDGTAPDHQREDHNAR